VSAKAKVMRFWELDGPQGEVRVKVVDNSVVFGWSTQSVAVYLDDLLELCARPRRELLDEEPTP